MYEGDTFFHLAPLARAGLVLLSAALAALTLGGTWLLVRRAHWPTRLLAALGAFVAFEWLSTQVYYLYYLLVFEGLPPQWVITWYPNPVAAAETLLFLGKATLSDHGRALLGWILIAVMLGFGRFRPPICHH